MRFILHGDTHGAIWCEATHNMILFASRPGHINVKCSAVRSMAMTLSASKRRGTHRRSAHRTGRSPAAPGLWCCWRSKDAPSCLPITSLDAGLRMWTRDAHLRVHLRGRSVTCSLESSGVLAEVGRDCQELCKECEQRSSVERREWKVNESRDSARCCPTVRWATRNGATRIWHTKQSPPGSDANDKTSPIIRFLESIGILPLQSLRGERRRRSSRSPRKT